MLKVRTAAVVLFFCRTHAAFAAETREFEFPSGSLGLPKKISVYWKPAVERHMAFFAAFFRGADVKP